MENKETFQMTYSAQQQQELQRIREKYLPKTPDKMERLRALDAAVTAKANVRAIALGVVGTLVLGIGMSLLLSDFGAAVGSLALPLGLGLGVVGLAAVGCAYPVYNRVLKRERAKAAPEILRLTEELKQG